MQQTTSEKVTVKQCGEVRVALAFGQERIEHFNGCPHVAVAFNTSQYECHFGWFPLRLWLELPYVEGLSRSETEDAQGKI